MKKLRITIQSIHVKYSSLSSCDAEEGQISNDQYVCMWGNSNIPYLQ